MENAIKFEYFELYDENKTWLGNVILSSNGIFSAVTDYGNFTYQWTSYGNDFKSFLKRLDPNYFATKMSCGVSYQFGCSKKIDSGCQRFAEKILPALQNKLSI